MEKPAILKVPPLPAMPRPRPMSAYQQTERDAFKPTLGKTVSVGDIPRVTLAEGNDILLPFVFIFCHCYFVLSFTFKCLFKVLTKHSLQHIYINKVYNQQFQPFC